MKLLKQLSCALLIGLSLSSVAAEPAVSKVTMQTPAQAANIIAYFSARQHGKTATSKTSDPKGLYRVLLSETTDGYLVQDFFQANHQPQSSAVLLKDAKDLDQFQVHSAVGEILIYNRNGQRFNKQVYDQHHNTIYVAGYSTQGKMLLEQSLNPENGMMTTKIWHSNGVLAFDLTSNTDQRLIDYQAWLRNGKEFNTKTCFDDRSLALDSASLDPCILQLKSLTEKYEKLWEEQMQ